MLAETAAPMDRLCLLLGQQGNICLNLGGCCELQRRLQEAEAHYAKSETVWLRLANDFPTAEQYADWVDTAKQRLAESFARISTDTNAD